MHEPRSHMCDRKGARDCGLYGPSSCDGKKTGDCKYAAGGAIRLLDGFPYCAGPGREYVRGLREFRAKGGSEVIFFVDCEGLQLWGRV